RVRSHEFAPRRHADHPRRHTVRVEGVLVGAIVPGREYDRDPLIVHLLGGLVDGILGVKRPARPPRVVHHHDVVGLLMVQDVVEAREGPEDEQDVAGADPDELRAWSDARVVDRRPRPQTVWATRDVRAVADRGLTVR